MSVDIKMEDLPPQCLRLLENLQEYPNAENYKTFAQIRKNLLMNNEAFIACREAGCFAGKGEICEMTMYVDIGKSIPEKNILLVGSTIQCRYSLPVGDVHKAR